MLFTPITSHFSNGFIRNFSMDTCICMVNITFDDLQKSEIIFQIIKFIYIDRMNTLVFKRYYIVLYYLINNVTGNSEHDHSRVRDRQHHICFETYRSTWLRRPVQRY